MSRYYGKITIIARHLSKYNIIICIYLIQLIRQRNSFFQSYNLRTLIKENLNIYVDDFVKKKKFTY